MLVKRFDELVESALQGRFHGIALEKLFLYCGPRQAGLIQLRKNFR